MEIVATIGKVLVVGQDGSTFTSKAILKAIDDALASAATAEQPAEAPAEQPAETPAEVPAEPDAVSGKEVFLGLGIESLGRVGPGKDDKDVQVYSFNQVFAAVLFDAEGRILYAKLDQLEVATPNYDGEGMPHFAGFPGQYPYMYDSDHDGKIERVMETNDDLDKADMAGWRTKRERGDGYKGPKRFDVRDELPLLPVWKVDKQARKADACFGG